MAQLQGLIVSDDEGFRKQIERLLRSASVPVSVSAERAQRDGVPPDIVIADIRGDAVSAMAGIERLRAASAGAGIFAVALSSDPDLILQAMRAGANEFFTWPLVEETFHGAIRRTAARRETAQGAKPTATTLVFFGAKGGAGTTTVAVNCAVELARLSARPTVIIDLKSGLGEVALVPGRASALHAARRRGQPAPSRSRIPAGVGGQAQVRPGDPRRIRPVRSAGRVRRQRDRGTAAVARTAVPVHRHRRRQPDQFVHGRCAVRRGHDVSRRESRRAVSAQCAAAARSRAAARRVRRARPRPAEQGRRAVPDSAQADRERAGAPDSPHVSERLQDRFHRAELRRAARADG